MDLSFLFGFIFGLGLIIKSIGIKTGMAFFLQLDAFLIVFGGVFGATCIHFPVSQLWKAPKRLLKVSSIKKINSYYYIDLIVELSTEAKKRGRLSLLPRISKLDNEFLKLGLQMIVDNVEPDKLEYIMSENLSKLVQRHTQGITFFEQMAKYAPGFGLLGTLIGLILLLSNLGDPSSVGPHMATALVATFYGVFLSQFVFLPISGRLRMTSAEEVYEKQLILEGLLAMANEDIPSIVKEKMEFYLPQHERHKTPKRYRSS